MVSKPTYDELQQRVQKRSAVLLKTTEKLKREVEERRRMEEVLKDREARARALLNAPTESALLIDSEGVIIALNETAHKRLGKSTDKLVGANFYDLVPPDVGKARKAQADKVIRSGEPVRFEDERQGRWFDQTIYPVFSAHGEVHQLAIFAHEITDRKLAEEELKRSHQELERRVEERTAELTKANEELNREIEERKRIEETLRRDQSSLAEAQRIAHLGNWDWNIVTDELQWSDEIYRIFGLTPQEFGATYEAFLNCVHPDDRHFVMKAVDEALYENRPYSIDHRIVLPDGTERIVHEEAGISFDNEGKPIRMIGTVHDITERKRIEEALQRSEAELRHLSSRLMEVQENERKRIAGELHDSIGQSLTAIKFGLENALVHSSHDAGKVRDELLGALIPVVQQASEEVRQIHTNLRPSLLDDLGIISTISWFCREFEKVYADVRIEKQMDIEEKEVPEPLKIVIFRVLQEALNNVSKHGEADLVRLSMKRTGTKIELTIQDNGQGFDAQHLGSVSGSQMGLGLTSMKERTELAGGAFAIESAPGAGTVVRASWPI